MVGGAEHDAAAVQDDPQRVRRPDDVEGIVPGNHDEPECRDRPGRQPEQAGQQDHAPAEGPQDQQQRDVEVEVELIDETTHDDRLEEHQPQPARQQIPRQPGAALSIERQPRAGPGQQKEHRRAEVRDPPREEQRGRGSGEIGRVTHRRAEIVPRVIERHDDHHDAAQDVDRFETRSGRTQSRGHSVGSLSALSYQLSAWFCGSRSFRLQASRSRICPCERPAPSAQRRTPNPEPRAPSAESRIPSPVNVSS